MLTNELIIKRPVLLTEKASRLREVENQVIFEVHPNANKAQIRSAIEALFQVGVLDVNTLLVRGKDKRMGRGYARLRNWKKAIVTLRPGDSIQFFDEESTEAPAEAEASADAAKAEEK
jgi:large subunit ribosomal protein L23